MLHVSSEEKKTPDTVRTVTSLAWKRLDLSAVALVI